MAITRAQQAKQMLQDGGRIGLQGGGADMSTVAAPGFAAREYTPQEKAEQKATQKLNERIERKRQEREREKVKDEILLTPIGRNKPLGTLSLANARFQRNMNINLARKRAEDLYERLGDYVVGDTDMDYDFSGAPKGLATLTSNKGTSIESTRPNLSVVNPDISFPSILGAVQDKIRPDTQVTLQNTLDKARDYTSLVNNAENMTNQEIKDALTELQNRGKTPDQINPPREGGGGVEPIIPVDTTFAQTPITPVEEEDYYASVGGNPFTNNLQLSRRFRAEGGIMNSDVIGGEFDFESARQMYGLGKLVKKVTKTVKKIAKSPIGKAALVAGGGYLLGGGIIPGVSGKIIPFAKYSSSAGSGFGFGNILPNLFNIAKMPGLAEKAYGMGTTGSVLTGILGASALAGLLTPEQEEEAQELARGEGIDIEEARRSILNAGTSQDFRAVRFRAEGGPAEGKEPVAKKTMPLLDMGGKEMDLREEGGFVPIGRMEKADDVPARLSKNEFVFTADAVRNAGDGDVDKGAEVMYNMMKNLEAGGEVSEESQGLEGARKMFQTSQRLEEVL